MFVNVVNAISLYAIPVIILVICTYGVVKKVKVYETFTEGAKEGFYTDIGFQSQIDLINIKRNRH